MKSGSPGMSVTTCDRTVKFGLSLLQHGHFNDRVYLMRLSEADYPAIIAEAEALVHANDYTKIIAKVPDWAKAGFEDAGYVIEATVPGFFSGRGDVYFMSKFLGSHRAAVTDRTRIDDVVIRARQTPRLTAPPALPGGFTAAVLTPDNASPLAALYRRVFETYPFPIHDPGFITSAMNAETAYFAVFNGDEMAAASSCEMDLQNRNAEMTDFATDPKYRSLGLASCLLYAMEREMIRYEVITAYTIARSASYGMNITFARQGYAFSGTLYNNTNISGNLESMNVWHKPLTSAGEGAQYAE